VQSYSAFSDIWGAPEPEAVVLQAAGLPDQTVVVGAAEAGVRLYLSVLPARHPRRIPGLDSSNDTTLDFETGSPVGVARFGFKRSLTAGSGPWVPLRTHRGRCRPKIEAGPVALQTPSRSLTGYAGHLEAARGKEPEKSEMAAPDRTRNCHNRFGRS